MVLGRNDAARKHQENAHQVLRSLAYRLQVATYFFTVDSALMSSARLFSVLHEETSTLRSGTLGSLQ